MKKRTALNETMWKG